MIMLWKLQLQIAEIRKYTVRS